MSNCSEPLEVWLVGFQQQREQKEVGRLELVSKELNQLAAILHVYARGLHFMK